MNFLVGSTGFVGSNLSKNFAFDGLFYSKNVEESFDKNPDLLVYSGVPAQKFLANKEPKKDMEIIGDAIENIKRINPKDYIITLEINGKQLTSVELATLINQVQIENSNITFIIGGSYGLDDEIINLANYHLSFSKMTFPHQLFRVMLLEQIYRSFKINNNESYHK